jgi:hypothetical protein
MPRCWAGQAPPHLAERLVGQLHHMKVIDHDGGAGQDRADRGPVSRPTLSAGHELDLVTPGRGGCCSPPGGGVPGGSAFDLAPALPCAPVTSTNPVLPPSAGLLALAGQRVELVLRPTRAGSRRSPQDPHRCGFGGPRGGLGGERGVHHRPGHPPGRGAGGDLGDHPLGRTPPPPPAACRNRAVSRARAGTSDTVSVNVAVGHCGERQRHRCLCHIRRIPSPPSGQSPADG